MSKYLLVSNFLLRILLILSELAKSIKKEDLFLLPNDKAMIRMHRMGPIDSLIEASEKRGAVVKRGIRTVMPSLREIKMKMR